MERSIYRVARVVAETMEPFAAAVYGLACAALAWALFPAMAWILGKFLGLLSH